MHSDHMRYYLRPTLRSARFNRAERSFWYIWIGDFVSQLRYAHWRRRKCLPNRKCSHCFWEVHPVTWAQYRLRCPKLAWRDREIASRNVIIRLLLAYLTVLSAAWIVQCRVIDNEWILCWEDFLRKRSWFGLFCLSTELTIALGYRDVI